MTNPRESARIGLMACLCAAVALGACDKKKSPKQTSTSSGGGGMTAVVDTRPSVSLSSLSLHPKVQFPEERLPGSQAQAEAIARLASAIAGGTADGLEALITPRDQLVLSMLVKSGEWKRRADAISVVRVCVINEPESGPFQVGLGIEDSAGAFLMGWQAEGDDSSWRFATMPIEARVASRAIGLDGAEMRLLELPTGAPAASTMMVADEEKKPEEKKKKKPAPAPSSAPGTLKPDRF